MLGEWWIKKWSLSEKHGNGRTWCYREIRKWSTWTLRQIEQDDIQTFSSGHWVEANSLRHSKLNSEWKYGEKFFVLGSAIDGELSKFLGVD